MASFRIVSKCHIVDSFSTEIHSEGENDRSSEVLERKELAHTNIGIRATNLPTWHLSLVGMAQNHPSLLLVFLEAVTRCGHQDVDPSGKEG